MFLHLALCPNSQLTYKINNAKYKTPEGDLPYIWTTIVTFNQLRCLAYLVVGFATENASKIAKFLDLLQFGPMVLGPCFLAG